MRISIKDTKIGLAACALLVALTACEKEEELLPGERKALREGQEEQLEQVAQEDAATLAAVDGGETLVSYKEVGFSAPSQTVNREWTHRNGNAGHSLRHPALGAAPVLKWSRDIGVGTAKRARVSADPIIADDRVFVMDANGAVSAFSPGGALLWQKSLVPISDAKDTASGGGLAYGKGVLVASTGYGQVVTMAPDTGAVKWRHKTLSTLSASPIVAGDNVVLVTATDQALALNIETGRIVWQIQSVEGGAGVLGTGTPAAAGKLAILPFGSGEVTAALNDNGIRTWSQVISGRRIGVARTYIGAISGDPVVSGDRIYVGTQAGKLSALNRRNGDRIWTVNEGAVGPVWAAGGSLFVMTDEVKLKRLDASDGSVIWSQSFPLFANQKKRKGNFAYYGPVLAGGNLYVAGSDGLLRKFDPETGATRGATSIPGGAASHPSVASGVMYMIGGSGQLLAFQ